MPIYKGYLPVYFKGYGIFGTCLYKPHCLRVGERTFIQTVLGSMTKMGPTLKIFLFPLTRPCLTSIGWSIGKLFYLTSQIPYPLNLIVNSPAIGNKCKYSKTCVKLPLKNRQNKDLNDKLSLNAGQKYCRMLPLEHSVILLTCIK